MFPCVYQTIGDFLRFHVSFFQGNTGFSKSNYLPKLLLIEASHLHLKKTDIMINFFPFQLTKYSDFAGFLMQKLQPSILNLSSSLFSCLGSFLSSHFLDFRGAHRPNNQSQEVGLSLNFSWGINPRKLT